jgi:hypothetical protein
MVWRKLNAADNAVVYQAIENPKTFRDREITFNSNVWSNEASSARISIDDGIDSVEYSSYHTGSRDWEKLEVVKTINKKSISVKVQLNVEGAAYYPAFFDDAQMTCPTVEYGYTRYTCYDIIEALVSAIGGNIIVENASLDLFEIYPKIDVQFGTSAISVLKQIYEIVPDRIKWFGNDAYIYLPQSTDDPVYYFTGATAS